MWTYPSKYGIYLTLTPFYMKQPKKIAILGGGMSALTTAYELSNYANWQQDYEITIYQMGWRVGGKTATGRGKHDTIEEVGIHILQGWYDNAFKILQDAYAYNYKHQLFPPDFPFQTWQDAFLKEKATLITQWFAPKNKWISMNLIFPENDLNPGVDKEMPTAIKIKLLLALAEQLLFGLPNKKYSLLRKTTLGLFKTLIKEKGFLFNFLEKQVEEIMIKKNFDKDKLAKKLRSLAKILINWTDKAALKNEHLYWLRSIGELALITIAGFLEDVYTPETPDDLDFTKINDLDFREWLKQKGLSELGLKSAFLRFIYTGTFANLAGKNGLIAAGTAMNFLSVSINYKGAFVWKFKAGTGDTMVAPIYTMLAHRGVKFKFFHKVMQVHHSTTGEIEQISMAKQVTLKQEPYQPLIKVKGVPAWTSEPLYAQIDDQQAKKLQDEQINLESAWSNWQNVENFVLQKGKDFDIAVLAIPIAALGGEQGVCTEIIAKNIKWQAMYKNIKTTSTQSIQTYITPNYADLGMNLQNWGIEKGATPNLVTYASPIYSWIDMSLVIPQESFSETGKPNILIYFCGSAEDPVVIPPFSNTQYPNEAREQLISRFEQWLYDNMGYFFPKGTSIEYPQGFNFDMLFDMNDSLQATGEEKLRSQTIRININPWDRYTLSVPQSAKYRLKTDASGFKNLFLAGDWIDFGVNVGYIEGAVNSGLQAAWAIKKK
jgi:uncharacterized protein with NAD-binding domain and iron-sulfur cluster